VEQFREEATALDEAEADLRERLAKMPFDLRRQLLLKFVKRIIVQPDGSFTIVLY